MAPKSTPGDIMARVIDLCQNFKSSDMHAFVMFVDHSALSDVKSAGTSFGEKFIQTNPDIGKAFMTFCTSWTTSKEDVDGKDLMHTVLDSAPGAVGSETPRIEVKSELESAYDCDTDVESEPMDQTEDPLMIIIKKESVTDSNMSENCDELGTSNIDTPDRSMKIEDVKAEKEKLYANPKLRHGMRKKAITPCTPVIQTRRDKTKLGLKMSPAIDRQTAVNSEMDKHDQDLEFLFTDQDHGEEIPNPEGPFLKVSENAEPGQSFATYACSVCEKTFKFQRNVKQHMLVHSETPVKCQKCSRLFESNQQLKVHMLRLHTSRFMCEMCGFECDAQQQLKNHRITKHDAEGKEKRVCPYPECSKVFIKKTVFEHHINLHLKNKPFKCDKCDKTFHCRYERNRHEKFCGNVEMASCKICGRTFSSRANLSIHSTSVHKHKVYRCVTCGKTYKYKTGLLRHNKQNNH